MKKLFSLLFLFSLLALSGRAQQSLSLAGEWDFRIDRQDSGLVHRWFEACAYDDRIELPGSMPQRLKGDPVTAQTVWTASLYDSTYYYSPAMAKYREPGNVKLPFFLTPQRHYVGVAWYRRTITVPRDWKGKHLTLFLERPHIETMVWVNGKPAGIQNSLCAPHLYELTPLLEAGRENTITIRVDNRLKEAYNVGQDSHSVTDQTQGNWNGIVGRMELRCEPITWIQSVQVYPDVQQKKARVRLSIGMNKERKLKGTLRLVATSFNTDAPVQTRQMEVKLPGKKSTQITNLELSLPMGDSVLLWDEFSPALYRLTVSLESFWGTDTKEVEFGMRDFAIEGRDFYVNGRPTMLRGTVENCDFPLTGYAPMDRESWMQVFRKCKEYGLNHMRFHSFCPPEAAFEAADRVGFYLQPEAGTWPNHGVKLGYNQPIDHYLAFEALRISAIYGNHASFCLFAVGNEPAGRWVDAVADINEVVKQMDPRRVYTGASVGGSWQWQPRSDYHVKAGARGLDWARRQPSSMDDFRSRIDTVRQPYVSHEMGQWCVFPDFSEMSQYTGVNQPKNFEIFRETLAENHLEDRARDFLMASGKLQILCYKHELERTFRTPHYAGFQMLALNDYSGQGTALVGPLNVFFREKGYVDAEEWRHFCAPTVLLARLPKFVYTTADTLSAAFEAAHFGQAPLKGRELHYEVTDEAGQVLAEGSTGTFDVPLGHNNSLGTLRLPLQDFSAPVRLNLKISLSGTDLSNDWNFWVYPAQLPEGSLQAGEDIYVADTLDEAALGVLNKGGKVLLLAAGKISYGRGIEQYFTPVFWNTSWFKMRPPHTTGLLIDNRHPLFRHFPTDYHSDLQWWELANRAQVMLFSEFPADFQPTVQSIDTWFLSRKIGMLFEARVGAGRLLMTTMDLESDLQHRVVARQMLASILDYMKSDDFRPRDTVDAARVAELFTKQTPEVSSYTKSSPDELRPVQNKSGR
ncbi:MAG: sugar-binding domain-containing protein [Bacteroidaceae bacterium]|jgi:hypothetical protein